MEASSFSDQGILKLCCFNCTGYLQELYITKLTACYCGQIVMKDDQHHQSTRINNRSPSQLLTEKNRYRDRVCGTRPPQRTGQSWHQFLPELI